MMELLHATDTRLGLVTNGERWMLVDAPKGETTGFASWYGNLWFEEPLTLRAFRTLLGVHRFFSAANDETLEAMLAESAKNQQEVTDRLGYQVREAVEEIIRSLDRLDQIEATQAVQYLGSTIRSSNASPWAGKRSSKRSLTPRRPRRSRSSSARTRWSGSSTRCETPSTARC
jgi:hypothetical protein